MFVSDRTINITFNLTLLHGVRHTRAEQRFVEFVSKNKSTSVVALKILHV